MAVFFYTIFLSLYKLGITIASLGNEKAAKWRKGRKNIFLRLRSAIDPAKKTIWFHCASLGEFEQGRPLIEKIKGQLPDSQLLISFFSPSGYEIRKDYPVADHVFYLPLDSGNNAKRFLNIINPSLAVFVKYDLWYYYLSEIKKRKVPSLLVSAVFRKEQSFFKWYGGIQRKMIRFFDHIFVQDENSKKLLERLGINNCSVSGDTRFDRVTEIAENFESIPLIEKFLGEGKCLVAGSTWKEDEDVLKPAVETFASNKLKLIIAPHEIDKDHIEWLQKKFPGSILFSNLDKTGSSAGNCLIVDNIGMLSRLYRYSYIAYVGGGFTKDGVHNVLEAAVYSKPIIFGPNFSKYREATELVKGKGAMSFSSENELEKILSKLTCDNEVYLLSSKAAGNYVAENKGATQKILDYIHAKRLLTS